MKHFAPLLICLIPPLAASAEEVLEVDSVVVSLIEQVDVPARERGVLSTVHVREGQVVRAGSELAQINDTEVRLDLNRASIELKRAQEQVKNTASLELARKSLELANVELRRADEAIARYRKAVPQSERDRLKLEVDRAELQIKEAEQALSVARINADLSENEVELARNRIERRKITCPIDGIVVQVNHRKGEWVEPGEPVVRIVRIDRLRAEGFVDLKHASMLAPGGKVDLVVDLPGLGKTAFKGELRFVSPEIDPIDGKTRFWAEISNDGMILRPGLRGSMSIRGTRTRVGAVNRE